VKGDQHLGFFFWFILGSVDVSFSPLLNLKKCQSRHKERDLLIPNKQQAMPGGIFSGSTRRAGPLFPPCRAKKVAPAVMKMKRQQTLESAFAL